MSNAAVLKKPQLRGVSHGIGAIATIPIVVLAIRHATTSTGTLAAALHGASVLFLLTASAIYHIPHWQPKVRTWFRRVDHTAIFILIAGTYTPLCLLAVTSNSSGQTLLVLIWSIAALGTIQSMLWPKAPRWVTVPLYLGMGWILVFFASEFFSQMAPYMITLIFVGGAFYTLGALAYARRWPNPKPAVFGYHEIFHLCVLAAVACHYVVVWNLISQ